MNKNEIKVKYSNFEIEDKAVMKVAIMEVGDFLYEIVKRHGFVQVWKARNKRFSVVNRINPIIVYRECEDITKEKFPKPSDLIKFLHRDVI